MSNQDERSKWRSALDWSISKGLPTAVALYAIAAGGYQLVQDWNTIPEAGRTLNIRKERKTVNNVELPGFRALTYMACNRCTASVSNVDLRVIVPKTNQGDPIPHVVGEGAAKLTRQDVDDGTLYIAYPEIGGEKCPLGPKTFIAIAIEVDNGNWQPVSATLNWGDGETKKITEVDLQPPQGAPSRLGIYFPYFLLLILCAGWAALSAWSNRRTDRLERKIHGQEQTIRDLKQHEVNVSDETLIKLGKSMTASELPEVIKIFPQMVTVLAARASQAEGEKQEPGTGSHLAGPHTPKLLLPPGGHETTGSVEKGNNEERPPQSDL